MGYINKSKSDCWTTPGWLFQILDWIFGFTFDVASSDENCLVEDHFTEDDDALSLSIAAQIMSSLQCNLTPEKHVGIRKSFVGLYNENKKYHERISQKKQAQRPSAFSLI